MTPEEEKIIEAYRNLGKWGRLEVTKQNGILYSLSTTEVERYKVAEREASMV